MGTSRNLPLTDRSGAELLIFDPDSDIDPDPDPTIIDRIKNFKEIHSLRLCRNDEKPKRKLSKNLSMNNVCALALAPGWQLLCCSLLASGLGASSKV